LTEAELTQIVLTGMRLPNGTMLRDRIQAILDAGLIEPHIADRLKQENQALGRTQRRATRAGSGKSGGA
jgi:hypothetical protein